MVDCPEVAQGQAGRSAGARHGVSASLIPGYNSAAVCPEPGTAYARAPERELAGSRWSVIGQAAEAILHCLGEDLQHPVGVLGACCSGDIQVSRFSGCMPVRLHAAGCKGCRHKAYMPAIVRPSELPGQSHSQHAC